jgi:integrase
MMLREYLKLAGVTRHELHHSERGRSMHITAHDLRSSTITWWAVRGDDALKIQRRVGHEDLQTTDLHVRLVEAADPVAFGVPFPPLPGALLE